MQIRVTFSSNYYKHNYSSDIPKYYYISDKNVLKKSLKKKQLKPYIVTH